MKQHIKILICIITLLFPLSVSAGMINIQGANGINLRCRVVSLKVAKFKNIVQQSRDFSCGAASLATLLRYYYGEDVNEQKIINYLLKQGDTEKIKKMGFSFLDLKKYALSLNYKANGYKLQDNKVIDKLKVPVIALIHSGGYEHFVVIKGSYGNNIYLADPMRGNIALKKKEFLKGWNGIIFVVLRQDMKKGDSYLDLHDAIADAPKDEIVRLSELGINSFNHLGMKNMIVFPGEF